MKLKLVLLTIVTIILPSLSSARIKVLVIDTGLDVKRTKASICDKHIDFAVGSGTTSKPPIDHIGHGTNMANIISTRVNPKKYCISVARLLDSSTKAVRNNKFFLDISSFAIENKVRLVNYSITGASPIFEEKEMFRRLVKAGILVNVAAGNSSTELTVKSCLEFPACYRMNGLVVVGAMDGTTILSSSNYGPIVDVFTQGIFVFSNATTDQGTSIATAVYTNRLLKNLIGE